MTTSAIQPTTELPHWAKPTPPPPQPTTIGISVNAQFYQYDFPNVILPEIRGAIVGLRVIQLGGNTESGPRDYLEVSMISDIPTEHFRLLLPADERPVGGDTAQSSIPNSVRTLLGALLLVDLTAQAVKLTARKGDGRAANRRPTFINVSAYGHDWESIAPVRAQPIGRSKADMLAAINQINQSNDSRFTKSRPPTATPVGEARG